MKFLSTLIPFLCLSFFSLTGIAQCDINILVNPSTCDQTTNFYVANINVEINNPPSTGLAIIYHEGYTHVVDLTSNNNNPLNVNVSVPYLFADAQNKTVRVRLSDNPNCEDLYTYQAPATCADVEIYVVACSCIYVPPWEFDYVCNDGIDNTVLLGQSGFVGVAWYNDDGDFVSSDQDLVITSNTPGMEDGSAYFYMEGINNDGMNPLNCCRTPILAKQCPLCDTNDQVQVEDGDIYLNNACNGVILTAPNGLCYRMKVTNEGAFISEVVQCP